MPNLSTLAGRLLTQELGNEDSTVLFTDARREAAVNDGLREFANITECLVRVSTVTVSGGTAEYDLNSTAVIPGGDFVRLAPDQAVEFHYTDASSYTTYIGGPDLPQRTLRWLDNHDPGWRHSTGVSSGMQVPSVFYLRAAGPALLLGFYPVPSTGSSASAKALVPYIAFSPVITSTQQPYTFNSSVRLDLKPYHMAAVHYAAHQLEKLRRDDQSSDRQFQKFMAYVQLYWQATRRKGGSALTYARSYFRRGSDGLTARDPRR